MDMSICVEVYKCMHGYVSIYKYMCVSVHACMDMSKYVYVHICINILLRFALLEVSQECNQ